MAIVGSCPTPLPQPRYWVGLQWEVKIPPPPILRVENSKKTCFKRFRWVGVGFGAYKGIGRAKNRA